MTDERKAASSVATDLRVAHLTRAVSRKSGIRFELHVPDNDSAPDLAESLRQGLFRDLPEVPGEKLGPVSVDEDPRDKSKVTIVYKPDPKRNPRADMRDFINLFREMEIPVTDEIEKRIGSAFKAFDELKVGGHAAAELARRSERRGPREPGSR
jgi:hypothetical protein